MADSQPTRRRPRRWRIPGAVCVVLVSAVLVFREYQPRLWKRNLMAAARGADRVTIDLNVLPNKTSAPVIEVSGADRVNQFLASLDFEPSLLPWHCMCFGEVLIRFHRDDSLLLTLSYHHGESLRVHDDRWHSNRNMTLTPRSRAAVAHWLEANGYVAPQPKCGDADAPEPQTRPDDTHASEAPAAGSAPAPSEAGSPCQQVHAPRPG